MLAHSRHTSYGNAASTARENPPRCKRENLPAKEGNPRGNNRTPSGLLAVRVNHSSASRNLGHPFTEQWNGEADGESALQPSSLFCHTHSLAYAAVARDTTAATAGAIDDIVDPASSIRHRRLRHRRLRHRPSRGRGAYQAGEGAPWLCAGTGSIGELGVRGIEVLSAPRGGCEARTAHRARPTRRACRAEIEGE